MRNQKKGSMWQFGGESKSVTAWVVCGALLLVVASGAVRAWNLGSLGFYGDEETTALAAERWSEGKGASMPSGMPYHRALPLTVLNAVAAKFFGARAEASYRLSAVVSGTVTCLVLWLLCRGPIGGAAALLVGLLIATSEWHIVTSREARMYAPFLLAFVTTAFAAWWWVRSGDARAMACTMVLSLAAVSMHSLGVLCVIFPLCWYLVSGNVAVSLWKLAVYLAIVILMFFVYDQLWVVRAYGEWREATGGSFVDIAGAETTVVPVAYLRFSVGQLALGFVGAVLGMWLMRRIRGLGWSPKGVAGLAFYTTILVGGFALGLAWIHAALICIAVALLMYPGNASDIVKKEWRIIAFIGGVTAVAVVVRLGGDPTLAAARELFRVPYPYIIYFAEYAPGVFVCFALGLFLLAFGQHREAHTAFRASALVAIVILGAIGMVSQWGGMRYLIGAYPFFLIVATYPMIRLAMWVDRQGVGRRSWVTALWAVLIVSGVLGGHGVPQAYGAVNLEYGDKTDLLVFGYPVYPDHKSPGQFVRARLGAGDIVVAEDMLQQQWYVGRVDYWLRKPEVAAPFLYETEQGEVRDIYVRSRLLTDAMLADLSSAAGRTWVITSGETRDKRDFYLSPAQQAWLTQLANGETRVFRGEDGITEVFCINCAANEVQY